MNIISIINKKRLGKELSCEEISYAFNGYLEGKVENYQMSSLLMAICIQGMNEKEIFALTDVFIESGVVLDLSSISGIKVDKHSTGGVGDKTTLIIGPMVASCGVCVPKMSGRGLGFTGGTIDKLESIPSFNVHLDFDTFLHQVDTVGFAVMAQSSDLVPLDKVIYALRDVTGTVESIPLIASSIMSKKIASGADKILIDIKLGRGALIKTKEEAEFLSRLMVKIGSHYHKEVKTIITNMDIPLGNSIGNSLEVLEAIRILKNEEQGELGSLCVELASNMVSMGKEISYEEAKELVLENLYNGNAYLKFLAFVRAQGGDLLGVRVSEKKISVKSMKKGILETMDALMLGEFSVSLGAGRKVQNEMIDPGVGIVLHKKVGDFVDVGDELCTLYVRCEDIDTSSIINAFVIC